MSAESSVQNKTAPPDEEPRPLRGGSYNPSYRPDEASRLQKVREWLRRARGEE
jgi:hypothetical protein